MSDHPASINSAGPPAEKPRLTIVVPTYNERERIGSTVDRISDFIQGQAFSTELLVVDDGSVDGTADLVESLRNGSRPPIGVIRNDHRGKAYTVRTGMLAARGRYVLFSDADLSTPIEEVSRFLPFLDQGYEVVIGSREAPGAKRFDEPLTRHVMGRIFTRLVQLITGQRFEDTQCGFKAFSRKAAQDIFSRVQLYGPNSPVIKRSRVTGFDVELLFLARKLGLRIREEPVRWYYSRGSKVDPLRDSIQNLLDVVKVRLYDLQGRYETPSPATDALT
ncbi:MAG TPA: dolichyl-phosphate beta-glucosyltransferase [Chloroflexota bacterium]|nr:dolichyl-phosphate beta-glucosyltransferase [Chloroflexota bacterium]